jgi:pantoate--beta-alanine ligase
MHVYKDIAAVRTARWNAPSVTWGLVPTMGYLHQGHLSLIRQARRENDRVGVSIFVNPIQFNNPDDLERYPQNLEQDLGLLEAEGADLVWTPAPDVVYPADFQTYIAVEEVSRPLEGAHRPGHFRGVTTVVAKLFNVFQPDRAYFGQKDAQQIAVIKQMVRDLNFKVNVVICDIVREPDGLAMSSRNANLSPQARQQATCLYQALTAARNAFDQGERNADRLRAAMLAVLKATPLASVDYVSVAHPITLAELDEVEAQALCSMAVFVDGVRLIDNIQLAR